MFLEVLGGFSRIFGVFGSSYGFCVFLGGYWRLLNVLEGS